jgi:hypothetical protein
LIDGKKAPSGAPFDLKVPFGDRKIVQIEVGGFQIPRTYTAELIVTMGARRRTVPVIIDWTKPK